MSWFEGISSFINTPNLKISQKFATVIILVTAVFVFDNLVGFTFNYKIDKKISQVETLTKIINDSLSDPAGRNYANNFREEVIKRENYWVLFQNILHQSLTQKLPSHNNTVDEKLFVIKFRYLLTGTGFYCLSIFIIPVVIFREQKTSFSQRLATFIVTSVIIMFIVILLYIVCLLVPVFSNKTLLYNYVINILIQFTSLLILVKVGKK